MKTEGLTPDQLKAVELVELAGYKVVLDLDTFQLWEGKIHIVDSPYSDLTPFAVLRNIRVSTFKNGYEMGQNDLKKELSGLLNN